jgi:hypothetical protein
VGKYCSEVEWRLTWLFQLPATEIQRREKKQSLENESKESKVGRTKLIFGV